MFGTNSLKVEIALRSIKANPDQPRKVFDEDCLRELSDSIREYGVLQPIIVRSIGSGEYELIAGERRYRAALMAECVTIPCMIMDVSEKDAETISLIENIQREGLNYLEEAKAYKRLIEQYGLTQDEIATKVGKKQSTISNKIRLLQFSDDIQDKLVSKGLTERHARALLKLEDQELTQTAIDKIVLDNLNVMQTEKLINKLLNKGDPEEGSAANRISRIHYKIYLNTLRRAFGTIYEAENNARYFQEDRGEYLEVKILIPKEGREIRPQQVAMPNFGIL